MEAFFGGVSCAHIKGTGLGVTLWTNYLLTLAIVALVLAALGLLARRVRRMRLAGKLREDRVAVIESALLSQHASLHVVRVGERYVLIGAADASVTFLCDVEAQGNAGCSARPSSFDCACFARSAQDDAVKLLTVVLDGLFGT